MKQILILVISSFLISNTYAQKFISKKQHINTVNNQYIETNDNMFFVVQGEKVMVTNKKGDKIYEEFNLGETKRGDVIVKYSINQVNESTTGKKELVRRSKDTFTEKTSKIVYELDEILN